MGSTAVREVRRGEVSICMLYEDHAVRIACARHRLVRVVSLDAATFGRELVGFFHDHEQCSSGAPAVIVGVPAASWRGRDV